MFILLFVWAPSKTVSLSTHLTSGNYWPVTIDLGFFAEFHKSGITKYVCFVSGFSSYWVGMFICHKVLNPSQKKWSSLIIFKLTLRSKLHAVKYFQFKGTTWLVLTTLTLMYPVNYLSNKYFSSPIIPLCSKSPHP